MLVVGRVTRGPVVVAASVIVGLVLVVGMLDVAMTVAHRVPQAMRRGIRDEDDAILANDAEVGPIRPTEDG